MNKSYIKRLLQMGLGVALLIFSIAAFMIVISENNVMPHDTIGTGPADGASIEAEQHSYTPSSIFMQLFAYTTLFPIAFFLILSIKIILGHSFKHLIIRSILMISSLFPLSISLNYAGPSADIRYGGYFGFYLYNEISQYASSTAIYYVVLPLSVILPLVSLPLSRADLSYICRLIIRTVKIVCSGVLWSLQVIYNLLKYFYRYMIGSEEKMDIYPQRPEPRASQEVEKQSAPPQQTRAKNSKPEQEVLNFQDNYDTFSLPLTSLLRQVAAKRKCEVSEALIQENSLELGSVLKDFGVRGEIEEVNSGPVVTLYEFKPAAGTKSSRVIGLSDDIARSMSAVSTRIAVIPGKDALGIEMPNEKREIVYLKELLESDEYRGDKNILPLILGKDIAGDPVIADLAKMPHLLVAGTTGSGKSVAINTMVLSLLYKHTPETCRFIMIDPKMLELSVYQGIPHLLAPVVTNPKKAVTALKWVVKEMERRYKAMSTVGVRNISGYNKLLSQSVNKNGTFEKQVQTGFDSETGDPIFETVIMDGTSLPYIVVIVDEMADLMLVAGKEIEISIQRLAQMARAAGIHIIMATQRPSVDVITGVIKANFPIRISFQVTSKIDSRTVLGEQGAEQLLGMGDMLYMSVGSRIRRVHGPFVDDKEVENVVTFLKKHKSPEYNDDILASEDEEGEEIGSILSTDADSGEGDLYSKALHIVISEQKVSTSYIQRCLKIGYNRAANIVERMEKAGVISEPNHVGKREVLQK